MTENTREKIVPLEGAQEAVYIYQERSCKDWRRWGANGNIGYKQTDNIGYT